MVANIEIPRKMQRSTAARAVLINKQSYTFRIQQKSICALGREFRFKRSRLCNGNGSRCNCRSEDTLTKREQSSFKMSSQDEQIAALSDLEKSGEIEFSGERVAQWVGLTALFGGGIWWFEGLQKAEEYFAGYLLEQSLSVDNLFVFILIFDYFRTPLECQKKCLAVGIFSAAVLRLIMIVLGIQLVEKFEPILILFAAILVYSSLKLLIKDENQEEQEDLSENWAVKILSNILDVTDQYSGDRFFIIQEGIRKATPMVLALAMIELSDVLFAVDSIPAVFGVTLDPFIVFSSNMFAILSLRSLYSFVSIVMSQLKYLDKSVALVLGFIGIKMLFDFNGVNISTEISLIVVASIISVGVAASYLIPDASNPE
eukprot:TRINITY_DN11424_c0_g2_i2.p1 TRINITY_DN11424_c0_g2~~TRINITY_DN11424_c0_g2_i2.p1  ORF type:complete len:372 (-),score=26.76 TRINITY_DN11424_c0_g2_i2:495-1610(-)